MNKAPKMIKVNFNDNRNKADFESNSRVTLLLRDAWLLIYKMDFVVLSLKKTQVIMRNTILVMLQINIDLFG